jgi:hypothetical protein
MASRLMWRLRRRSRAPAEQRKRAHRRGRSAPTHAVRHAALVNALSAGGGSSPARAHTRGQKFRAMGGDVDANWRKAGWGHPPRGSHAAQGRQPGRLSPWQAAGLLRGQSSWRRVKPRRQSRSQTSQNARHTRITSSPTAHPRYSLALPWLDSLYLRWVRWPLMRSMNIRAATRGTTKITPRPSCGASFSCAASRFPRCGRALALQILL